MNNWIATILLMISFVLNFSTQIDLYDSDQYVGPDYISSEHQNYLNETHELHKFDSAHYENLVKAMRLKSKGRIRLNLDKLDPNFDPDNYIYESDSNYYYSDDFTYWDSEYEDEYIQDWDEYYYQRYEEYEKFNRQDDYEVKRIEKEKKINESSKRDRNKEVNPGSMNVWLIVIMALVLALILGFLFFNGPRDEEVKNDKIDDLPPSEIPKSELELMLEAALADGDYRRAIRVYFIFIMKDLSEKGWINWQKKKTNLLYIREMKERPFSEDFNKTVSVYEVAWYGKRKITEADYKTVEPLLQKLLLNLSNHS